MRVELFQYNHFGNIRKFFKNDDFEYFFCDNNILGKKMKGSSKAYFLGYFYINIDEEKNINFFDSEEELENFINKDNIEYLESLECKKISYEKYIEEKNKLISNLEKQLEELKNCFNEQDLETYKIKYNHFEKIKVTREKNKNENIEKYKQQIIEYLEHSKDTFKLKNMLYDLRINNKTFYNYKLDEFLKDLKKI